MSEPGSLLEIRHALIRISRFLFSSYDETLRYAHFGISDAVRALSRVDCGVPTHTQDEIAFSRDELVAALRTIRDEIEARMLAERDAGSLLELTTALHGLNFGTVHVLRAIACDAIYPARRAA